ncbi:MerR family transcriptional regulator [Cellulomonas soli]
MTNQSPPPSSAVPAPVLTTGALARAASLTDKAVRLYADRGLLRADRDPVTGRREFGPDQVGRARAVGLLRSLDLPLVDVARVLDDPDPVARFDALWGERRADLRVSVEAGEYVRASLAGRPRLPFGEVRVRDVAEVLTLSVETYADLPAVPDAIRAATARLFEALEAEGAPLVAAPFVEYPERATEGVTARLIVHAPVAETVRPPSAGFRLGVDPAHTQAFVALTQRQVADQAALVVVHDHLSTASFADDLVPVGANREIYLPGFGTGEPGPVMEVAVPVGRR